MITNLEKQIAAAEAALLLPSDDDVTTDLEKQIAEIQAAIADRDQVIEKQVTRLQKYEDDEAGKNTGWLITAANPLYDGELWGIRFYSGLAFIPSGQVIERFISKPLSDEAIKAYPPDEQAAIREREKIPTTERAVRRMETDFGYKVEYFTPDRKEARLAIMAARAEERKLAELATAEARKIAQLAGMR